MSVPAGILLVAGGVLAVLAAGGLVRLPDTLSRLQAATKMQLPGLGLVLLGAALAAESAAEVAVLALVALAQLLTVPVLGQVLGHAAYRTGALDEDLVHRPSDDHQPKS